MEFLTVKQVAERASVSQSLVYEWEAQGSLPCYRFGRPGRRGAIRVDPLELEKFVARCKQEATPPTSTLPPLKHIKQV